MLEYEGNIEESITLVHDSGLTPVVSMGVDKFECEYIGFEYYGAYLRFYEDTALIAFINRETFFNELSNKLFNLESRVDDLED